MKKNVMMRVASVLLIAVLITTCGISGTFAKYVTTASGSDTARVAKWGVNATVTGEAFAKNYNLETALENSITLAVESSTDDKLVAPGTSGTFTGVALAGTPEVAVQVTKTATVTITGWEIDEDGDDDTDATFYCPLVFTINGQQISGLSYNTADALANALKSAIESANGYYGSNTNLANIVNMNGNYSWTWAYAGQEESLQTDAKDTALGDLTNAPSISIVVACTVTQVD